MLVEAVKDAFNELDHVTLSKCFLTLQSVMEQAMLNKGGGEYKIPHIGKYKLLRSGELPDTLARSAKAINADKSALEEVVV
ncbi:hypothetical protein PI124_g2737 [Phytophthora idaei]|nr:hypothetical protein PI125_g7048 [Phytophthora idaei]KAG3252665.1 hypothetical protein PI124_g2737 [Phytophthora idaei]